MFQFMRGVALVAVMLPSCEVASAADYISANFVMPGCRAAMIDPNKSRNIEEAVLQGYCAGTVRAIGLFGPRVCSPSGWTTDQAIRVVVQFIDGHPARLNEDFVLLAVEALRAAWPCKR
jgi:hypothetical protein